MANKLYNDKFNSEARNDVNLTQSEGEKKLVAKIKDRYRASYMHKDGLGINSVWSACENYWSGNINKPEDDDDPGSETNIVQPIIESQVADLVTGDMEVLAKGTGPSDAPYAKDVSQILKWVWQRNKMVLKLDEAERDRLNLGTVGWKVYWDGDALKGRGMPVMMPCSPDTLFPDPKIKDVRRIQEGDFFIQVLPFALGQLRRMFGKRAQLVKPEGSFKTYSPQIFGEDVADGINEVINDQALLYEYWEKDDDGNLRRIYMAGDIILDDSDWEHKSKDGDRTSFYEHGKYPFVLMPCYKKKGRLWGIGDTEQLMPIQDMINDFDDQIRMNARLMGNIQIVVGTAAGVNLKKWTNKPGLKIPAKDHTAFQTVQPATIPGYIVQRREKGFQESEIVSGRSDVVEGRRSGSLRAASAIVALQEAGSRRANHKKLMLQEGFVEVIELVLDYVKEFMDVEQAFDITENNKVSYLWFKGTKLKDVPWKTLNENFDPTSSDPQTAMYKDLYETETDGEGNDIMTPGPDGNMIPQQKLVTKEAEFDLEVSFGAGMPNSKSFIYQATLELHRENLITQQEGRKTLKEVLNWPIIPDSPEGMFAGREYSPEQLAIANGNPPPQGQVAGTYPSSVGPQPPDQSGMQGEQPQPQIDQNALAEIMAQLQPETAQQLMAMLGGGMQ